MNFTFYNPGKIRDYLIREVSVSIRCNANWLFTFDSSDNSWDLLHDDRIDGETQKAAVERITDISPCHIAIDEIRPVCPYSFDADGETVYGMLFFVSASAFLIESGLPYSLFSKIPERLSRGETTRRLFTGTQGWLNMQSNADELWDIYDENRNKTGRFHRRGDFLEDGDYHLVVHVWLLNSKGEFLLTKRAPNKGFPNTWETSGGAAQAGDDSLSAALREVQEETGLVARKENAKQIFTFKREDDFCDVWMIRQDFDLSDVVLLEGETIDKQYVGVEKLRKMYYNKELIQYSYFEDLLSKIQI